MRQFSKRLLSVRSVFEKFEQSGTTVVVVVVAHKTVMKQSFFSVFSQMTARLL